ncbi:hypothetical protein ABPG72_007407, partial [Tetrahymena utriculariae]
QNQNQTLNQAPTAPLAAQIPEVGDNKKKDFNEKLANIGIFGGAKQQQASQPSSQSKVQQILSRNKQDPRIAAKEKFEEKKANKQ